MKDRSKEVIFSLNVNDFESVLGRKMTDEEIDTCINKFSINDWVDYVDVFLDVRIRE